MKEIEIMGLMSVVPAKVIGLPLSVEKNAILFKPIEDLCFEVAYLAEKTGGNLANDDIDIRTLMKGDAEKVASIEMVFDIGFHIKVKVEMEGGTNRSWQVHSGGNGHYHRVIDVTEGKNPCPSRVLK